jgi:hypothetical protein
MLPYLLVWALADKILPAVARARIIARSRNHNDTARDVPRDKAASAYPALA